MYTHISVMQESSGSTLLIVQTLEHKPLMLPGIGITVQGAKASPAARTAVPIRGSHACGASSLVLLTG